MPFMFVLRLWNVGNIFIIPYLRHCISLRLLGRYNRHLRYFQERKAKKTFKYQYNAIIVLAYILCDKIYDLLHNNNDVLILFRLLFFIIIIIIVISIIFISIIISSSIIIIMLRKTNIHKEKQPKTRTGRLGLP